jgi:hypothetical protein
MAGPNMPPSIQRRESLVLRNPVLSVAEISEMFRCSEACDTDIER